MTFVRQWCKYSACVSACVCACVRVCVCVCVLASIQSALQPDWWCNSGTSTMLAHNRAIIAYGDGRPRSKVCLRACVYCMVQQIADRSWSSSPSRGGC